MRKMRRLVAIGLVAGSLSLVPAAPAHASCDTELGDMCKFMDFVCDTYPKVTHVVFEYCRR
ncbi:MAG: hypothetical protein M3217_09470 [Actinomycetota bacterium]|nr:hypothetical protein [Actinomycetota bacterium]